MTSAVFQDKPISTLEMPQLSPCAVEIYVLY